MLLRDVLGQAVSTPLSRPGRSLLTTLGTVLGVALLVASVGLTASAGARINRRFDALLSTEVHARPSDGRMHLTEREAARAQDLHGVLGAGLVRTLPDTILATLARPQAGFTDSAAEADSPQVMGISAGALAIMHPRFSLGRGFNARQESRRAHVALVGSAAVQMLGLDSRRLPTTISIDGLPFLLEGELASVRSQGAALLSVVIPDATAADLFSASADAPADLVVATKLGYGDAVASSLPAWLAPTNPASISVSTPPDPTELKQTVSRDLTGLFTVMAAVGLLIGVAGIANTTLVSVLERVPEIGLRRALGAKRGQIATQFLLESLVLGAIGGTLGAALGVIGVTAVAVGKGWAPIVPLWVCVLAPLAGAATGVLAGAFPAMRAARVDPIVALAH
jgi:putative ABC transport system permease protein